jgi:hypothetical protein
MIDVADCTGATSEQWTFNSDGTVRSSATGLCLERAGLIHLISEVICVLCLAVGLKI